MKIFIYLWEKFIAFFTDPFWRNWIIIVLILITIASNAFIWYFWLTRYRDLIGIVPIAYSSAVILLNTVLANLSYKKEILVSFILMGTGLAVQIIYVVFLNFFARSFTY